MVAPYAYRGRQWLGYDDEQSAAIKSEYIKTHDLGGAMVWSIDTDDFNGDNSDEGFPLMKTINRALVMNECLARDGFCNESGWS